MAGQGRYFAADTEYQEELTRRRIAEAECDPLTVRYLVGLGVAEGWRCLDVGAGARTSKAETSSSADSTSRLRSLKPEAMTLSTASGC